MCRRKIYPGGGRHIRPGFRGNSGCHEYRFFLWEKAILMATTSEKTANRTLQLFETVVSQIPEERKKILNRVFSEKGYGEGFDNRQIEQRGFKRIIACGP